MLDRLKNRWVRLSLGDRIALLVAEACVVSACFWLLPLSEFTRDWQTALVAWGLVFAFLQGMIIFVVAVIASLRQEASPTLPPSAKRTTKIGQAIIVWVTLAILYWAGGYVADWMFPQSSWATKWRYSLADDLKDAVYVIERQPHDCEFLSAPLGAKHCHYDKVVATVRVRTGQSGREVSYDEGKSWSPVVPSARAAVYVSWSKVQE